MDCFYVAKTVLFLRESPFADFAYVVLLVAAFISRVASHAALVLIKPVALWAMKRLERMLRVFIRLLMTS